MNNLNETSTLKEKIVKLKKLLFYSESDKYAVFIGFDDKKYVGNVQHNPEYLINLELKIVYEEKKHHKYGVYYQIHSYESNISDLEYFLRYVVKGFTKKNIKEILKKYDEKSLIKTLEESPEKLLSIKGIGKKKLKLIKERFPKYQKLFELSKFLGKLGISFSLIEKIYEFYGENSINIIKENPYKLTEINGIGFLKADEIALKIGIEYDSPLRISAAVIYIYKTIVKSKGHTVLSFEKLLNQIFEFLSKYHFISKEKIVEIIEKNDYFKIFNKDKKTFITSNEYLLKEMYIYSELTNKNNFFKIPLTDCKVNFLKTELINNMQIRLSKKQDEAFNKFLYTNSSVFILAGYAGTGKTTFAKLIMDAFSHVYGKNKIVGCALSGMAANRIKQKTGYAAFTIHSLLGYANGQFYYSKNRKLTDYKLIVIDEASMIDIDLFYALIQAVDLTTTKLMIIGDPAQLPPIGAGDVFNDLLLYSEIPNVILDEIFRQNNDQAINLIAQDIRKGHFPQIFREYKDFTFYEEKENERILDMILNHYVIEYKEMIEGKPTIEDWLFGIQVLTPIKNGLIGVENLNLALKNTLNPSKKNSVNIKITDNKVISLRDKVIHLKNELKIVHAYIPSITKEQRIKSYEDFLFFEDEESNDYINRIKVFNGQIGIISNIFQIESEIYIETFYPNEEYYVLYSIEDFKNKIVDLGYAISIHKSQGSEYKKVLMPISKSFYIMLNTKLLYTAITRAKDKITIIGNSDAFKIAIKKKKDNLILTNIKVNHFTAKPRQP